MFKMTSLRRSLSLAATAALALAFDATAAAPPPLKLDVYNPGDKGIFAMSSTLITGKKDAVLIDAQFARADAEQLVQKVKASGKRLTTVYISAKDPDFYFGLDVIHAAFPEAKIVASPQTVAAIKASQEGKLKYWAPILKDNAPKALVLPEPLTGHALPLEGQDVEVVGLDGPSPELSFVWIPSLKAVVGGVAVFGKQHVWTADEKTPEARDHWRQILARIDSLHPAIVVPGHYGPGAPQTIESVNFTRDYLNAVDEEAARSKNSTEFVAAMKKRYPGIGADATLDLSAKVVKGEMQWPAQ